MDGRARGSFRHGDPDEGQLCRVVVSLVLPPARLHPKEREPAREVLVCGLQGDRLLTLDFEQPVAFLARRSLLCKLLISLCELGPKTLDLGEQLPYTHARI